MKIFALLMLAIIAQPIWIGWMAQTKLHQVGVLWALIALAINIGLVALFDVVTDRALETNPQWDVMYRNNMMTTFDIMTLVFTMGISTAVMLIVLYTLPKPKH